jgi:hypothetical protein
MSKSMLNRQFETGRIYNSDNIGEISFTISPFDPNFLLEIEIGIRSVIDNLVKKNYLPISCCEGHGSLKNQTAYFTMAFPSMSAATEFSNSFKSVSNTAVTIITLDRMCSISKEELNKDPHIDYSDLEFNKAVEYYNNLFLRSYEDYVFVKVVFKRPIFFRQRSLKKWLSAIEYLTLTDLKFNEN